MEHKESSAQECSASSLRSAYANACTSLMNRAPRGERLSAAGQVNDAKQRAARDAERRELDVARQSVNALRDSLSAREAELTKRIQAVESREAVCTMREELIDTREAALARVEQSAHQAT